MTWQEETNIRQTGLFVVKRFEGRAAMVFVHGGLPRSSLGLLLMMVACVQAGVVVTFIAPVCSSSLSSSSMHNTKHLLPAASAMKFASSMMLQGGAKLKVQKLRQRNTVSPSLHSKLSRFSCMPFVHLVMSNSSSNPGCKCCTCRKKKKNWQCQKHLVTFLHGQMDLQVTLAQLLPREHAGGKSFVAEPWKGTKTAWRT